MTWSKNNKSKSGSSSKRGWRKRGGYGSKRQFDKNSRGRGRGRRGIGSIYLRGSGNWSDRGSYKQRRMSRGGWQKNDLKQSKPKSTEPHVGTKRSLKEPSIKAKKRVKTDHVILAKKRTKINHVILPLSTVLLAKHSTKDNEVPELIFGRFYECTKEAKLGRKTHFLRITITQGKGKEVNTVSFTVPFENICAVSVLSGMNHFEKLLKAHTDRITLRSTIMRWSKVVEKREEIYVTKIEELALLPEVESEPEEEPEKVIEKEVEAEPESKVEMSVDDDAPEDPVEVLMKKEQDEAEKKLAEEKKKLEVQKKTAENNKLAAERMERELKRKERRLIEVAVERVAVSVEKARKIMDENTEKLNGIEKDFGEQLALFQHDTDSTEAHRMFLQELKQNEIKQVPEKKPEDKEKLDASEQAEPDSQKRESDKEQNTVVKEPEAQETAKQDKEDTETQKGESEDQNAVVKDSETQEASEQDKDDTEMGDGITKISEVCSSCGASNVQGEKFCAECGAKQLVVQTEKDRPKFESVKEMPVWLAITLKKPLEKFYASNVETSGCNKDILGKASMIVLGCNPKAASAEKQLKTINNLLEGPWKEIRKESALLLSESSYSLEKTLHYLVKLHKRQEVCDNILDTCQLCESRIKRMHMEIHLTQICMMREEACVYCKTVLVMKKMEEHHDKECTQLPIPCPQKCGIAKFPRSTVEEHYMVCKNTIVVCDFNPFGCNTQIKRHKVAKHMKDNSLEHVQLLKTRLKIITEYLQGKDEKLEKMFDQRTSTVMECDTNAPVKEIED